MEWNAKKLNDKQIGVLTWVRDGCPEGVFTQGWEHRITARALERHGLVRIRGRGPAWAAHITAMGRTWLGEGSTSETPLESDGGQLLRQVAEAGGSLTVVAAGQDLERWRRRVRASMQAPERPNGKRLTMKSVGYWAPNEHTITLANYSDDLVTTRPVPVPNRGARYHSVVRAYLDDKDWHFVSDQHLRRAGLILQAVAAEAERRHIQVVAPRDIAKNQGQPIYKAPQGQLWLLTEDEEYSVEIREVAGKGGAKRAYASRLDRRVPSWVNRRHTEFVSTGRLRLTLKGRMASYDGVSFRDAPSRTVESQLPAFFAALDRLVLEAKWADEDAARKKVDEARRREEQRERARAEFTRRKRWEHFVGLVDRYEESIRLRSFLEAAEVAAGSLQGETLVAVTDHLAEIRAALRSRDPIQSPEMLVPIVREPSDRELDELVSERKGQLIDPTCEG